MWWKFYSYESGNKQVEVVTMAIENTFFPALNKQLPLTRMIHIISFENELNCGTNGVYKYKVQTIHSENDI